VHGAVCLHAEDLQEVQLRHALQVK
jgi:hypothetical protein